ncbi:hypothetical protein THAOC_02325 [Thalassiosira oceanica]|uniref:Uncharacterized protein n=1 Tax=Thalassiosira oceanica TaxID=159749 RepID=K0TQF0_THAOC|nr:hypothetical protein THAOC_02325 [Thalassiosira oceanica]|eukprot:EJK75932.1 hypothetical protein THAOC_02325 [Thalassiosira oceanica]
MTTRPPCVPPAELGPLTTLSLEMTRRLEVSSHLFTTGDFGPADHSSLDLLFWLRPLDLAPGGALPRLLAVGLLDCGWTCPWLDFSHPDQDDDETTAEVAMKSGNGGGGRRGSGDAKVAQRGGNLLAFFSKKPAHHGAPPASAVHGNEPPASHSNKTTPFAEMLAGAIHRNGKTPAFCPGQRRPRGNQNRAEADRTAGP